MNDAQLSKIEARWLASSGGPWSVQDFRSVDGAPYRYCTPNLVAEFEKARNDPRNAGKQIVLGTVPIYTIEDASRLGIPMEKLAEDLLTELADTTGDVCLSKFRCIYAIPPAAAARAFERTDSGKGDEPEVSFAVLPSAKPEDVEFILHATEDVGSLIHEVRTLRSKLSSAIDDLKAARQQSDTDRRERDSMRATCRKLRDAVSELGEIE